MRRREDVPRLNGEQAAKWKAYVRDLRDREAGKLTAAVLAARLGDTEARVKDPLSRFSRGDQGELRRWFVPIGHGSSPAKTEGWIDTFAKLAGTTADAMWTKLRAIADGFDEASAWHPAFPGVRVEDALIEPQWLSEAEGLDATDSLVCVFLVGHPGQGRRTAAGMLRERLGDGWSILERTPAEGWERWRRSLDGSARSIGILDPLEAEYLDLRGPGKTQYLLLQPWSRHEASLLIGKLASTEGVDARVLPVLERLPDRLARTPELLGRPCSPGRMIGRIGRLARGEEPDPRAEVERIWQSAALRPGADVLKRFDVDLLIDFWSLVWRTGELGPWTRLSQQDALAVVEELLGGRLHGDCFEAFMASVEAGGKPRELVGEYRRRAVDFVAVIDALVSGGCLTRVGADELDAGASDVASSCLNLAVRRHGVALATAFGRVDEADWMAIASPLASDAGATALLQVMRAAPRWARVDAARFAIAGLAELQEHALLTPAQKATLVEAWATALWSTVHAPVWPRVNTGRHGWPDTSVALSAELRGVSMRLVDVLPPLGDRRVSDVLAAYVPEGVKQQVPAQDEPYLPALTAWLAPGQAWPRTCDEVPEGYGDWRVERDIDWSWLEERATSSPPDELAAALLSGDRALAGLDDERPNRRLDSPAWHTWRRVPLDVRCRLLRLPDSPDCPRWQLLLDLLIDLRVGLEFLPSSPDEKHADLLMPLLGRFQPALLEALLLRAMDWLVDDGRQTSDEHTELARAARMFTVEGVLWVAEQRDVCTVLERFIDQPAAWLEHAACWGSIRPDLQGANGTPRPPTRRLGVRIPASMKLGVGFWEPLRLRTEQALRACVALHQRGRPAPLCRLRDLVRGMELSNAFLLDLEEIDLLRHLRHLRADTWSTGSVPDLSIEKVMAGMQPLAVREYDAGRSLRLERDLQRAMTDECWWGRGELAKEFAPLRAIEPREPVPPMLVAATWIHFAGRADRRARLRWASEEVNTVFEWLCARVKTSRASGHGWTCRQEVLRSFGQLKAELIAAIEDALISCADESFLAEIALASEQVGKRRIRRVWAVEDLRPTLRRVWPEDLVARLDAAESRQRHMLGQLSARELGDAEIGELERYVPRVQEPDLRSLFRRRLRRALDEGRQREAGWFAVAIGWDVDRATEERLLRSWIDVALAETEFGESFLLLDGVVRGGDDHLLMRLTTTGIERWKGRPWLRAALRHFIRLCLEADGRDQSLWTRDSDLFAKGRQLQVLAGARPRFTHWDWRWMNVAIRALDDRALRDEVLASERFRDWELSELADWAVEEARDSDALVSLLDMDSTWLAATRRLEREAPERLEIWCFGKLKEAMAAPLSELTEPRALYTLKRRWPAKTLEALLEGARNEPAKSRALASWLEADRWDFGRHLAQAKRVIRQLHLLGGGDQDDTKGSP